MGEPRKKLTYMKRFCPIARSATEPRRTSSFPGALPVTQRQAPGSSSLVPCPKMSSPWPEPSRKSRRLKRPGWGMFPAGSVLQSIGSPGGSSTRLPSISKLPTLLPTCVTVGRLKPISTANTTSPVHLNALFVVTACTRIVPSPHRFKPRNDCFSRLSTRVPRPRGIRLEGNEGTACDAAAVSRAQAMGDETQNETPQPARTVAQPPHAQYDELSDGITVARVTAVWSRSPATVSRRW